MKDSRRVPGTTSAMTHGGERAREDGRVGMMSHNLRTDSMDRHKRNRLPFGESHALPVAEKRRLNEAFERIAAPARRKPAVIHSVRHHGALYDAATLVCVLATHAMIDRDEKLSEQEKDKARSSATIAGLAHLAEQELALLALLESAPDASVMVSAQRHDANEDVSETEHHITPNASTKARWLSDTMLAIAAEKAKAAVLRPGALEAYASRGPRSAA